MAGGFGQIFKLCFRLGPGVSMPRLRPEKLHVTRTVVAPNSPDYPRRYTLTHSDTTGELYLTIGRDYNRGQISGLYTRLMRDEVLAELNVESGTPTLHVWCHVSGGIVFGTAGWRESIFRRELPLVLEALRHGDRELFDEKPDLDSVPVLVHFKRSRRDDNAESFGRIGDYKI